MSNGVSLLTNPLFIATDSNGNPLAGGKVYTYQAGTLIPLATYTDATLTVPNTNPVILDEFGSAQIWLGSAVYKLNLLDVNGVQQANFPIDNLQSAATQAAAAVFASLASTAAGQGDALIAVNMGLVGEVPTTQDELNSETVSICRYMTSAQITSAQTGTLVDCTAAVQNAWNNLLASTAYFKDLYVPRGVYNIQSLNIGVNNAGNPVRYRIHGPGTIYSTFNGVVFNTAPVWTASTTFVAGSGCTNGTNQYVCVTGGVSASSGGPTGTGTGIVDGGVIWNYLGTAANASAPFYDLVVDCMNFESTQLSGTKLFQTDYLIRLHCTPGTHIRNVDYPFYGTVYSQSLRILDTTIRGALYAVISPLAYDFRFEDCTVEQCTNGVWINGTNQPAVSAGTISNNCIESISNIAILLGPCQGVEVCGNYMESNGTPSVVATAITAGMRCVIASMGTTTAGQWEAIGCPTTPSPGVGSCFTATGNGVGTGTVVAGGDIYLDSGTAAHEGLRVQNNDILLLAAKKTAGGYGITWGKSTALQVLAGGNFCTGNLHNTSYLSGTSLVGCTGPVTMFGDTVSAGFNLYWGYTLGSETTTGRTPLGRAVYNDGMNVVTAFGSQFILSTPYSNETCYGGGAGSVVGGTTQYPVVTFSPAGAGSPQATPGYYARIMWAIGSVVWNTAVTASTTPGWVCTTAGTPGTWTAMPVL